MDYRFKTPCKEKEFDIVEKFLLWQNLDYPAYETWVKRKAIPEAKLGDKKIILGFNYDYLIADLIYQIHKKNPDFIELKNLRVHPMMRDRYCARFMLRQVEVENRNEYKAIICDAPSEFPEIIGFMQTCGYIPILSKPLYDNNEPEIVMLKLLKPSKKSIIVPSALDMFKL